MERKEIIARISWSADASQHDRQTGGRLKKTRCSEREERNAGAANEEEAEEKKEKTKGRKKGKQGDDEWLSRNS